MVGNLVFYNNILYMGKKENKYIFAITGIILGAGLSLVLPSYLSKTVDGEAIYFYILILVMFLSQNYKIC